MSRTCFQYIHGDILYRNDRHCGAKHNANASLRILRTDYEEVIRINRYGMRVSHQYVAPDPQPGCILLAGDSWTFGDGVNFDDSFAGKLSHSLSCQMLNIGACGYNLLQVINSSAEYACRFKPRLLVICYISKMTRRLFVRDAYGGLINRPTIVCSRGTFIESYPRQLPYRYIKQYIRYTRKIHSPAGIEKVSAALISFIMRFVGRAYLNFPRYWLPPLSYQARDLALQHCAQKLFALSTSLDLPILIYGLCEIDQISASCNQTLNDIERFREIFRSLGNPAHIVCLYGKQQEVYYQSACKSDEWTAIRKHFMNSNTNHPNIQAHDIMYRTLKHAILGIL